MSYFFIHLSFQVRLKCSEKHIVIYVFDNKWTDMTSACALTCFIFFTTFYSGENFDPMHFKVRWPHFLPFMINNLQINLFSTFFLHQSLHFRQDDYEVHIRCQRVDCKNAQLVEIHSCWIYRHFHLKFLLVRRLHSIQRRFRFDFPRIRSQRLHGCNGEWKCTKMCSKNLSQPENNFPPFANRLLEPENIFQRESSYFYIFTCLLFAI